MAAQKSGVLHLEIDFPLDGAKLSLQQLPIGSSVAAPLLGIALIIRTELTWHAALRRV